jgi:hypothetical protein
MTPAGTSSLQHFLSNLQAKIFAPNCVASLLIHLIMMPLVHVAVPYFFSFILPTLSPWICRPESTRDPYPGLVTL